MHRTRTATLAGTVVLSMLLASLGDARAALRRPRFEPTDLEMEDPGRVEVDVQLGLSRDATGPRLVLPNFELDLGLAQNLELDIDGTVSLVRGLEQGATFTTQLDHLWISAKIGLTDVTTDDKRWAFTLGAQLGPRVPLTADTDGIGFQALLLAGLAGPRTHLVLNLGGFSDPTPHGAPLRPSGLVLGLDAEIDLDDAGRFAWLGEVFFAGSLSGAPHEGGGSAGVQWSPTEWLDLSLVAIAGSIGGGVSYGALLGASMKFRAWR